MALRQNSEVYQCKNNYNRTSVGLTQPYRNFCADLLVEQSGKSLIQKIVLKEMKFVEILNLQHDSPKFLIVVRPETDSFRSDREEDVDENVENNRDELDSRLHQRLSRDQNFFAKNFEGAAITNHSSRVPFELVVLFLEPLTEELVSQLLKHLLKISLHLDLGPFLVIFQADV
jgi:hypothetical protein